MNPLNPRTHSNIAIASKFISTILILFSLGCTHTLPTLSSDQIYKHRHSFRYPANHFHHPSISSSEKWIVYEYIEPWQGGRKLYYSEADKQQKKLMPTYDYGQTPYYQGFRYGEWSLSGDLYFFEVITQWSRDSSDKEHLEVVRFSSDGPKVIDRIHSYDNSYSSIYWFNDQRLAIRTGFDIIEVRDYSKDKPEIIRTIIQTRNFQVSKNGTILFVSSDRAARNSSSNTVPGLFYIANLNDKKIIPKPIFKDSNIEWFKLSPNGKYTTIILPSEEETELGRKTSLVDLKTMEIIHKFPPLAHLSWSPDGLKLAYQKKVPGKVSEKDGKRWIQKPSFFVYDIKTGIERDYGIGVYDHYSWGPKGEYIISNRRYSPNYIWSTLTGLDHGIFIYRLSDGQEIGRVSEVSGLFWPIISNKGNYILWGYGDYNARKHKIFVVRNQFKELMYGIAHEKEHLTSH